MDKFNFYIPIDGDIFQKGRSTDSKTDYKNMYLQGVASTSDCDVDGEILEPSGFNLDLFKSMGLINYDHLSKRSPKAFIGEPVEAVIKDNKFIIKAKLWEKSPIARDLWDTLHIMEKSGSSRKLAWSIEGVPLQRNPANKKHITKSIITNVAVTFMPKNSNTFAEIVKGVQEEDYIEPEYDFPEVGYLFKGVYGGHEYTLNKDFTITKAMIAGTETGQGLVGEITTGSSLKTESLDDDLKILTIPIETINWLADDWDTFTEDTKKALQKSLHATIIKGKKGIIGEIREWGGKKYKKLAEGKWVEVGVFNMTKQEHEEDSKKHLLLHNEAVRKKDLNKMNLHRDIAIESHKEASKLSDKEFSDKEVGVEEKSQDDWTGKTISVGKNGIKYRVESIKDGVAKLVAIEGQNLGNSSPTQEVRVSLLKNYATTHKKENSTPSYKKIILKRTDIDAMYRLSELSPYPPPTIIKDSVNRSIWFKVITDYFGNRSPNDRIKLKWVVDRYNKLLSGE